MNRNESQSGEQSKWEERITRAALLATIFLPMLGFAVAIYCGWNRWVSAVDLWTAFVLYVCTAISISVGFHRCFTHRSFECTTGTKLVLGILGSIAGQGPLYDWVSTHRKHHQCSDRKGDPHSPHTHGDGVLAQVAGLWHAHVGWIFSHRIGSYAAGVEDLEADWATRGVNKFYPLWVLAGLFIPGLVSACAYQSWTGFWTGVLWGGLVRIFLVHHITWSINSICHLWGDRPFSTRDESRNNLLCALVSFGEGWHNNHHAFPTSARIGLRWWQVDAGWWLIQALTVFGLAHRVKQAEVG